MGLFLKNEPFLRSPAARWPDLGHMSILIPDTDQGNGTGTIGEFPSGYVCPSGRTDPGIKVKLCQWEEKIPLDKQHWLPVCARGSRGKAGRELGGV